MQDLIKTECELRRHQSSLGNTLITATIGCVVLIGAIPLLSTMPDENIKWATIIMSESYFRLITFLSIPLVIGLTSGIILVKSSVKKIAESNKLSKKDILDLINEIKKEEHEKELNCKKAE